MRVVVINLLIKTFNLINTGIALDYLETHKVSLYIYSSSQGERCQLGTEGP